MIFANLYFFFPLDHRSQRKPILLLVPTSLSLPPAPWITQVSDIVPGLPHALVGIVKPITLGLHSSAVARYGHKPSHSGGCSIGMAEIS